MPTGVSPNFRSARQFLGPAWLVKDGAESELLGYTVDSLKDTFLERLRIGHLARYPQQDPAGTPGPDDALAALGRDRRIVRGINEPSAAYAARLVRWLDDWSTAGNPFALMKQLAAYCGPLPSFETVDVKGNWYSLTASGTKSVLLNAANWDWDGAPDALTRWSRFWVIIYPNGLWVPGLTCGPGNLVSGTPELTLGSTATSDQVAAVRGIVRDWKPAGTLCVNIILAFDNTSFNPSTARDGAGLPNGTWGSWSTYTPREFIPARLSTARFWDGI